MMIWRPCSTLLVLFLLFGACAGPSSLSEAPLTASPAVDGSLEEWGDRLTTLGNDPVAMAALPTDSLVYVAVLVRDRALVRSIAQKGLVVWVDPAGETNRTYGVQYPIGLHRRQVGRDAPRRSQDALDAVSRTELEVLRGDTLRTRIPARFSSGLRGALTLNAGSMICELALPVGPAAESEHGLTTQLGATVGIGLEIPTSDKPTIPEAPEPDIGSAAGRDDPASRTDPPSPQRPDPERQSSAPDPQPKPSTLDRWVTIGTGAP